QKPVGTGRYASGQRRCQICEIFIKWEGLWCPCCGYRLRTKPRNLKYKAKLRARVEAEAQEATGINSIETVEETVEVEQPIVVEAKPARKRVAKAKTAKAEKTAKTVKATRKPRATKASKVSVETAPEEAIAIKA
ncbi:MAG: hypothetical protein ACKOCQ_02485, partial [Candidatus Nitrosotenuis sp.]